jgi:nitrite reductase (NADH) small subunit
MNANGTPANACLESAPARQIAVLADGALDLGPIDAIAPGQGRAFIVAGRTIAVFRQRDGRVFATDNQCPHRGGPLAEGILGDGKVICPLHGWKLDLASGRCLGESASVGTYDVHVINGRVLVAYGIAP